MPYHGLYNPSSTDSYKLSRSAIESFIQCPHCFYLSRRLGISQPIGYPFTLNSAVDHLLKKEFDIHRAKSEPHPLMSSYGISAIPYSHPDLNIWRANFEGIQYLHKKTNLYITGAIDDVWINPKGELIVVDYKATSKSDEVNIDADWQMGYKRQMEIYQWLLRKNGFKVSNTGYFVYCNGKKDEKAFDAKLEFDIKIIPYKGNDGWIEGAIGEIKKCLENENVPPYTEGCEWCEYQKEILELS
jgi:CRISPR/Cas system-associated exonuclease Cas4 (RecB family)